MALEQLIDVIEVSCLGLIKGLQSSDSLPALNLRSSARLPVMAALHKRLQVPIVLLTDRPDHALTLADELGMWSNQTPRLYFPEPNPLFYERASWGDTTRRERLVALTALASYHIPGAKQPDIPPIIIIPARALMTRTIPRRDFLKSTRTFRTGQTIQIGELIRLCLSLGYEPVNTVIATGQFARRGGIMDLWPPAEIRPARIEFFGDEIETLRLFDPTTQRTIRAVEGGQITRLLVSPAREYVVSTDKKPDQEEDDLSEFHIPLLHDSPASPLDYLPQEALVFIDDRQALYDTMHEIEEQAVARKQDYITDGTLDPDFPIPYLSWSEIVDSLGMHRVLDLGSHFMSELAWDIDIEESKGSWGERFIASPRFAGQLKMLLQYISEIHTNSEKVVVVSRQSSRLEELWMERNPTQDNSTVHFVSGSLTEGWIFETPESRKIVLLTDGEIFGWRRPERRRRPHPIADAPEYNYSDLEKDDWVVHVDHGVARFNGVVLRTMDGVEREYLCLEFADDAQLYVPVHQADRLTRYVGSDSRTPHLSRLGGAEWRNVKSMVKEAVEHVAEELLDLYAQRSIIRGHAFSPDTPWQKELEASFPYIETDDQLRVLKEVKQDMEKSRPMDRLICGDVGYGKTEVALRATFKALMDGKQVAILVPTTILAQQHFHTFQQRLAAFPVEVEMLSRFRTSQQQNSILGRLNAGQLDIVIGTHRLLSSDVAFKDLGLLIIDEEQRFGVTHKEKLKQLRAEVDVLTMTATPIPRTLYMTLSGIRDISTIETPPEERMPIVTHVGPYSPKLIRQAILRELERGGQVFFVHNRVQTITAMLTHLRKLVPESRIGVAHGQMPEIDLSKRMEEFTDSEIDVLLCTSIIESGLDIPNANTLIVDRADMFGLAQLYQLRGRVGRGGQRAYAYFFRHRRKRPTLEGSKRLETIAENTQLGAGFSIAMRDLEIRGAGDILGTRQHGHIAAVGFHLYTSLLSAAVQRIQSSRGLPYSPFAPSLNLQLTPVNVDLPIPIGLPAEYIPDVNTRVSIYRRMADIRAVGELDALSEEFTDRFGPLSEPVLNLFFQLKVKLLAEKAGIASIKIESGQLVFRFPDGSIPDLLPDLGTNVRHGKTAIWMKYEHLSDWKEELVQILECMQETLVPEQMSVVTSEA